MRSIEQSSKDWVIAVILCAGTAICVVLPFVHFGIPSGHDFEFHVNSWMEVVEHWKYGTAYPHWAATAHWGYGEARFIFYPPFSWTLGAVLGLVLPWKTVPTAYMILVLTLSGSSMYGLAKRWVSTSQALWAAAFYTANPYHLVIVYWRSAFAELLCAAYFPLLLLLILELDEKRGRIVPALGLLVSAAWLTNVPSAVMMTYSLALLTIWLAVYKRSAMVVLHGLLAMILGMLAAAVYLVPILHQRAWINMNDVLAPGLRPLENYLFAATDDPDHNRFNWIVSVVGFREMVLGACALWIAKRRAAAKLWLPLTLWAGVWGLLMLKWALPIWDHLPELRYVQFPWRPLLCINIPIVLAIVIALERIWLRVLVCAVAIYSVPFAWRHIQPPWWDSAADVTEMFENQHNGTGNEGVGEYVPAGVDPYDADAKAPLARFEGIGPAKIQVERWWAESRALVVETSASGRLVLKLFNYPRWQVSVNGKEVATTTSASAGQMVVPLPAGRSRVQITWVEGPDRSIGAVISACTLLLLLLWLRRSRNTAGAIL